MERKLMENNENYRDTSGVTLSEDDRLHFENSLTGGSITIDEEGVVRVTQSVLVGIEGTKARLGMIVNMETGEFGSEMGGWKLTDEALAFLREKTGVPQTTH